MNLWRHNNLKELHALSLNYQPNDNTCNVPLFFKISRDYPKFDAYGQSINQ